MPESKYHQHWRSLTEQTIHCYFYLTTLSMAHTQEKNNTSNALTHKCKAGKHRELSVFSFWQKAGTATQSQVYHMSFYRRDSFEQHAQSILRQTNHKNSATIHLKQLKRIPEIQDTSIYQFLLSTLLSSQPNFQRHFR